MHLRELAQRNACSMLAGELKTLQPSTIAASLQYKDLLAAESAAGSAHNAWRESERVQMEQMRQLLDPIADIRKRLLGDAAPLQIIKDLAAGQLSANYVKDVLDRAKGLGSASKMLAQHAEDSRAQIQKLLGSLGADSGIQSYLKDFEHVNKHWKVPNEVSNLVGSFKEVERQLGLGKVTLPTIDWASAGTLVKLIGEQGLQDQLAHLGIGPDGDLHQPAGLLEKGIFSRKKSDVLALLSLFLSILFFTHQELSSRSDKAKTEAFQTQATISLETQTQQLQSLSLLIGQALLKAGQEPEERFVVRTRATTVRTRPEHGSSVEGKLLPNEVVRAVGEDGKWIEIEYYHWLREEYRIGWALKKYFERVPANHSKSSN